jgi:DNA-binding MurR/RpiR family transcriptional regulator
MTPVLAPTPLLVVLGEAAQQLGAEEQRLYAAIADGYPRSLEHRAAQLLRAAEATPHHLDRLLTAAGLLDYDELRRRAEREEDLKLDSPDVRLTARLKPGEQSRELLGRVIRHEQDNLQHTLETLERSGALELAAERIISARRRFVVGDRKSTAYALHLVADLTASMSGVAFIDGLALRPLDVLCDVRADDVLIGFCFRRYSRSTLAVARQFRAAGGFVVGITDDADGPMGRTSDLPVVVRTTSASYADSPTAVAAAVHILATLTTASARGARRRLDRRNQLARELDIYEEA